MALPRLSRPLAALSLALAASAAGVAGGAAGALAAAEEAASSTNSAPSAREAPATGAAPDGAASEGATSEAVTGEAVTGEAMSRDVAEACMERLNEVEQELNRQGRVVAGRQLRALHQAATIFAEAGLAEACEGVVEGIRAYGARQAGADGMTEQERAAYVSRLQDATPLAEVGSRYRAGSLIGDEVVGMDGDVIGEVEDVMLSAEGSAGFVLIGTGGLFGIGEDYVPVETGRLRVVDRDTLALGVNADVFEQAPRIDTEQIDEEVERWAGQVQAWWREKVAPRGAAE